MGDLVAHDHPFVDLVAGDYAASISTFGGGLRSLTFRKQPLLTDYPKGANPPLSAGNVLAPWPNRVADGAFIHDGVSHRLDITEPSRANAIHGFVDSGMWKVEEATESSAKLIYEIEPQAGWPWALHLSAIWALNSQAGLKVTFEVLNLATEDAPFGLGLHPYLTAADKDLNDCTLTVPVTHNLPLEPIRNLPAGPLVDVATVMPGLNTGKNLTGVWMDHCFVDEGPSRRREATLVGPDGRGVKLWADQQFKWFQIYTADPARREGFPGHGRAVAVEPMTCPPDALRSGRDLIRLAPDERRTFEVGFEQVNMD